MKPLYLALALCATPLCAHAKPAPPIQAIDPDAIALWNRAILSARELNSVAVRWQATRVELSSEAGQKQTVVQTQGAYFFQRTPRRERSEEPDGLAIFDGRHIFEPDKNGKATIRDAEQGEQVFPEFYAGYWGNLLRGILLLESLSGTRSSVSVELVGTKRIAGVPCRGIVAFYDFGTEYEARFWWFDSRNLLKRTEYFPRPGSAPTTTNYDVTINPRLSSSLWKIPATPLKP